MTNKEITSLEVDRRLDQLKFADEYLKEVEARQRAILITAGVPKEEVDAVLEALKNLYEVL